MQKVNSSNVVIDVKNLYVIYNKKNLNSSFVAVKDFSYQFKQGKIYCIIGESGSGKSSLINCFNGLNKPDYGSIKIVDNLLESKKRLDVVLKDIKPYQNPKSKKTYSFVVKCAEHAKYNDVFLALKIYLKKPFEINKASSKIKSEVQFEKNTNSYVVSCDENLIETIQFDSSNLQSCIQNKKARKKIKDYSLIRRNVGMVYQFPEFQLFKTTVISDAAFGVRNMKVKKEEAIEKAKKSLLDVGISSNFFESSPFGLSGGQKRRVALAGIFAIDPQIFVFDEPTAGLDPQGEQEMIDYMINFKKQGKTIFVVTHSMDQVLSIADEVLVIHDGKLVKSGLPYDIFLDKQILKNSRIELPHVIKTILALINSDKKFEKLLKFTPKNVEELSQAIIKVNKGGVK